MRVKWLNCFSIICKIYENFQDKTSMLISNIYEGISMTFISKTCRYSKAYMSCKYLYEFRNWAYLSWKFSYLFCKWYIFLKNASFLLKLLSIHLLSCKYLHLCWRFACVSEMFFLKSFDPQDFISFFSLGVQWCHIDLLNLY